MERKILLNKLINNGGELDDVLKKLNALGWDFTKEIVRLRTGHVKNVMESYLRGILSDKVVECWANLIETREDIEVNKDLAEVIHLLANPILYGSLSESMVKRIIDMLEKYK